LKLAARAHISTVRRPSGGATLDGDAILGSLEVMSLLPGGYVVLNYDFSPFYRSTVGFDRLLTLLDKSSGADNAQTYPPYNIERTGENNYRITLAVAGFAENELSVETKEGVLTIRGAKESGPSAVSGKREMLYQGIAARAFERRFHLADHVSAVNAKVENGLLHVELVRELPEAQKPRVITIQTASPKAIDAAAARHAA
jgi:molecular chaperone IbpA